MAMADENQVNDLSQDESKKDTVRINLPQGIHGKAPVMPTPTVRLKPALAPNVAATTVDTKKATAAINPTAVAAAPNTKKATAAISPAAAPVAAVTPAAQKTKKDTSRVQVPAAKPTVPEMPRPTVKLKREEPTAVATPTVEPTTVAAPTSATTEVASATSGLDLGLALAAMIVALVVAGYLFSLSRG